MADQNNNGNGVYLVATDGTKIPLRRDVLLAFKKFFDGKQTGSVTVHFKTGGVSGVEDRLVYQYPQQST